MTTKQQQAIDIVVESGGKVSASKAMVQAGYSKVTATNPSKLTSSKAYQEAMAKMRAKHNVTLDKYVRNIGLAMDAEVLDDDNVPTGVPNHAVRLAGNRQAEKILQVDKHFGNSGSETELTPADLAGLAGASDEIELTKLLFRRTN